MASERMNVLVYSGTGSTAESVRHCLYSLRRLLSPNYAVNAVTGETILKEPWLPSCALLVFPGGADLGYCKTLNGDGNRRIKRYVNAGGSYLGLCAGGYYGSSTCEFEVGNDKLEVIGDRELGFFPGICRGSAFSGFVYNSEEGASAAELKVQKDSFSSSIGVLPDSFRSYFNGGSVFVDAEKLEDRGVEILASYTQDLDVDPGNGAAAVIYRKVGDGHVVLTGPHPEFAAVNLSKDAKGMKPEVVDAIAEDDKPRKDFLKACLVKLGLKINEDESSLPSLSPIHVSSSKSSNVSNVLEAWESLVTLLDGERYIKAEIDTFHLEQRSALWSMGKLANAVAEAVPGLGPNSSEQSSPSHATDAIIDYNKVVKKLVTHSEPPSAKSTPYFNHQAFFASLESFSSSSKTPEAVVFGETLLYGEVVTSTSTLLEKNLMLTNTLPTGATFTATTQVSGRGRGSNIWISPAGALMFSTVLRHPLSMNAKAPVVFIQYLAALAVAEGMQTYDDTSTPLQPLHNLSASSSSKPLSRYRRVPVKLKWPNDVYALDPAKARSDRIPSNDDDPLAELDRSAYSKIGGILVNSSYSGGDYTLVVGIGLNLSNAAPTTSLNALVDALNGKSNAASGSVKGTIQPYTSERLLARILSTFQALYGYFCVNGFAGDLEKLYYKHWLHSGQTVTLEEEGGARARIKGVTTDWGLLLAEELVAVAGGKEVPTGKMFALQSDSNSFDFFRGLVKRKI